MEAEEKKARIISVRVENVKGVELAELVPQGDVTVIGGKSHQGKSSFSDAIVYALAGKRAMPPMPLRDGEDEAEIEVVIENADSILPGKLRIRRTISRKDEGGYRTELNILDSDGEPAPEPQTLLDALFSNKLGFDPMQFDSLSPKDQANTLKDLVGLDFSELDKKREEAYDERTRVNRQAKDLDGAIKKMPIYHDAPTSADDKRNVADIVGELRKIEQHNAGVAEHQRRCITLQAQVDRGHATLKDLQERVRVVTTDLAELQATLTRERDAKQEPKDVEPVMAKIAQADEFNQKIESNVLRLERMTEANALKKTSANLTREIERIDREKAKLAKQAKWPIDGLSFGSVGVMYQGHPFEQLADSERRRIAIAIAIGLNPRFPFVRIKDGSHLDVEMLEEVAQTVSRMGGQAFIERVSTGPECHVIFEEGRRVR